MENKIGNRKNIQKIFLGAMLMMFGLVLIVANLIESNVLVLVVPGITMLVWGCLSREAGWIIPGAIVSSIAAGAEVLLSTSVSRMTDNEQGALFMLIFACGWFMVTLLTRIFTGKAHYWALIPGFIIAGIGGLLLTGSTGEYILEMSNYLWAGALVVIGLIILVKTTRK